MSADGVQGGAKLLSDFVAGRPAIFRADAFDGFSQAEDVSAIGDEVLFAVARVAMKG